MKYLDLFSGIGGFALGIQQAYESNNEYAPLSEESEPQERQEGGSGPLVSTKHSYTIETGQPHYVLDIPKSTNMQFKSTKNTSQTTETLETSQLSLLPTSQTSTCSLADSLAKLSVLLENAGDLTTLEELSFLKSLGFSETKDPDIFYSKMSKVYLVMTAEKLSRQYLGFSPTLGMSINGKFLTAKTSESPRIGNVSSLSEILEENPGQKYFLSEKATEGILRASKMIQQQREQSRQDLGKGLETPKAE
jgi:hypothetical protein